MLLKLRRSQRMGGIIKDKVVFELDARSELTPEETELVNRYGLGATVIYDSETRRKLSASSSAHGAVAGASGADAATRVHSGIAAIATAAMAIFTLRITVASLTRGQHIDCKTLEEVMGAEEALREACAVLRGYLNTASLFNGAEVLMEY